MEDEKRICTSCREEKPLTFEYFYRVSKETSEEQFGGFMYRCKKCDNRLRDNSKRSRRPEQIQARESLSKAIKRGIIKRQPCEVCGNPRSHGHHPDYSRPLDVKWLCQPHHQQEHNLIP
jgi:hypothetical protein